MRNFLKIGIVMFFVAIVAGFLLSKFWDIFKENSVAQEDALTVTNTVNIDNVKGETRNTVIMQTATIEEKVLPTTKLFLEKNYQDCKHTVRREVELPVEMVNSTKKELIENYGDWIVKEFSRDEITLYKLVDGLCDEHFMITAENGVVVIYRLDEEYNKSLYEKTDIYTEYLPEEEVERLKDGIFVYTISNLNSELENME